MTRREQPIAVKQGEGLSFALAEHIADWVVQEERREGKGSWVVGLYGERGAGKTSMLLTLLDALDRRSREKPPKKPAEHLVLPTAEDDDRSRAVIANLLKPAALRDHDELIFEVLRHLQERYGSQPGRAPASSPAKDPLFNEARAIEVRRKHSERFWGYEKEVAVSQDDLRQRTIDIFYEAAASTVDLKKKLGEVVDRLRGPEQTLVVFVDDLDLHPERALELLEIFHVFFDQPGVVIVLAADKSLLLDGIALGLEEQRGLKKHHLAGALLAKYVPYEWHLPGLTKSKCFDLLWRGQPAGEIAARLKEWWPSDEEARTVPRDVRKPRESGDAGQEPVESDVGREHYRDARQLAKDLISQLLPTTYRGLHSYNNRLHLAWGELEVADQEEPEKIDDEPTFGKPVLMGWRRRAFYSGVLAFDGLWPQHALWHRVRTSLRDVYRGFVGILDDKGPSEWAYLLRNYHATSPEALEVEKALRNVARLWGALSNASSVLSGSRERRFLPVSLNSDAREVARPYWEPTYAPEVVDEWHVDLRALIDDPNRVSGEELKEARQVAAKLLRERHVDSFAPGVTVFLKATLPFAVWLGWLLRKQQNLWALNQRGNDFVPFYGPGKELVPYAFAERVLAEERVSKGGPADVAVLLVDLLGKSTPGQLDAFRDEQGTPVAYGLGVHLLARLGRDLSPSDTEPFLLHCVKALDDLARQGVKDVHLGLAMPDTLAFLLGQQLHARVNRVHLYEYRRTTGIYEYMFDLEEP